MTAPNDPRPPGPRTVDPAASAPGQPLKLSQARPESTVTLMVQSGQAPGALTPGQARDVAPAKAVGALARAWAAVRSWF